MTFDWWGNCGNCFKDCPGWYNVIPEAFCMRQIPYHQIQGSTSEWLGIRRVNMPDETYPGDAPTPYNAGYAEQAKAAQELMDVRGSMHLGSLRTPTTRSILLSRIEQIKNHLKAHEDCLAVLDANKETEKLLDSLRKLGI